MSEGMNEMVLHQTRIRLSKVVRLTDAFSGEPVLTGVRMTTHTGKKSENRGAGYFLFLDVDSPQFEVRIESPIYQTRHLKLAADGGAAVEEILLYPAPSYPLRAGLSIVRGRAEPGSILRFHLEEESVGCRLFADYRKGERQLSFYYSGGSCKSGWYIRQKQRAGEYFSVLLPAEEDCYRLQQPLQQEYRKKDAVLYPAGESMADEKGAFYLLLPVSDLEKCSLHYLSEGTSGQSCGVWEILCGRENWVDIGRSS